LQVNIRKKDGKDYICNIARAIIAIIDAYVATKKAAYEGFLEACRKIAELGKNNPNDAIEFVIQQLKPNVDARVF
jgi:ribosomal protein S7